MLTPENAEVNKMLNEYVSPPRLKIIQPTAKAPLSEMFGIGDVCLMPTMTPLAKKGVKFSFVPVFFFPEFLACNPMGAETFIRDRSFDRASPIAKKAQDPSKRSEPWDKDPSKSVTYQEVLSFLIVIVGHEELMGTACAVGFARSEYKTGQQLASMIKMRGVPMFGTVWDAQTKTRNNASGTWQGLEITPSQEDSGYITDQAVFEQLKEQHRLFKEAYDNRTISVNYDDSDVEKPAAGDSKEF